MTRTTFGFETDATVHAFSVDAGRRTITGLAVPYGVVAVKNGVKYTFTAGSIRWTDPTRVKLLLQHDRSQAVGKATELRDTPEGLYATFSVARGDQGDRALSLAEDGVLDGLSVGLADGAKFDKRDDDIYMSVDAPLAEISLTPNPAFDDARVSSVAAEADQPEGNTMTTETEAAQVSPVVQFDTGPITDAIAAGFAGLTMPAGREVIPAAGTGVQVTEPGPYSFDADAGGFQPGGQHDFASDLQAYSQGDHLAALRVLEFMKGAFTFDTDLADGAALNPSKQRPDLYVDQRSYEYGLWAAVRKETLTEVTPIVLPKYNTSSGLVAAHTEATEPAVGAFSVTSQTITPGAVSGKVEITRELWDQAGSGSNRVSNLIFAQMVKGWFEALEAKVVAVLDAASPTGITLTTAGVNKALSGEIAAAWAALQYVRGGFSFDTFAVQIDLYKRLAGAVNDGGDPLFPMLNPSNRVGSSSPRYARMNVHGVDAFPEWALAATGAVAASSYLFDKASVWAAASAPQRLEWNFGATVQTLNIPQLSYVTLGIWGYSAAAITDLAGVREVIYDPTA